MSIFKRLKYLFTAGKEIDVLILLKEQEERARKSEGNRYRLGLCYKHRQEQLHTVYSEQHCDYCKLLIKLQQGVDHV